MLNEVFQGNCLDIIPKIPDDYLDSSIIDPPYGVGFNFPGDNNIFTAKNLLNDYLSAVKPKIKDNGFVAVFWTLNNIDVCIDIVKKYFTFRRIAVVYLPKGSARPFLGLLPRTQAIVIGQKYLSSQPTDFHFELSTYLKSKLKEKGYNNSNLAKLLGCNGRLVMKWTRNYDPAWCLPTPKFYQKLKTILELDDKYDCLLTRDPNYKNQRKDFDYHHDCYIVKNDRKKYFHPAEKPLEVLNHLVPCLTPKDGIVLDGFAGSGTTLLAAKNTGRNFIGVEMEEKFCNIIKERLK